jgi:hypothetical protein
VLVATGTRNRTTGAETNGGERRLLIMRVSSEAKPRRGLRRPHPAARLGLLRRGPGPGAGSRSEPAVPPRRRADPGPEDRAVYTCGCGLVFTAAVSTSVGCPHCGHAQAW